MIKIFTYTDRLYKLVRPKKLMFLAVDGVAPRAKMNQQRARRFRSSKERETLLSQYVIANGELPKTDSFDSNCITPGTEFMHMLSIAFQKWIQNKMRTDPFWKNGAEVIFSGPDVPGEGEHKIMDFIREMQSSDPNYQLGQWRHCLYGLDADLIMLSLVTHEPFFVLLREKQRMRMQGKDALQYTPNDFELLEVSILRKMLQMHFKNIFNEKKSDQENEKMLAVTRELERNFTTGLDLVSAANLKEEKRKNNLSEVNVESTNRKGKEKDFSRVIDDFVLMCFFIGNDFLPSLPHLDIADGSLNTMMQAYLEMFSSLGGHLSDKDRLHLPRLELFLQELARREPLYFEQRSVDEKDPEYKGAGYKDHYYRTKFGLEPNDIDGRRRIVQAYVEGLAWVARYYHKGCKSWTWFYPYLYAPLASDLVELGNLQLLFSLGRRFTPLMQLLSVLPPQSGKFLPPAYEDLMTNPLSPLSSYYPRIFNVDENGKRNAWESVVLIPFIDEDVLIENVALVDHAGNLTDLEKDRNRLGVNHRYLPDLSSPSHNNSHDTNSHSHRSHSLKGWGNVFADENSKLGSNVKSTGKSTPTHMHQAKHMPYSESTKQKFHRSSASVPNNLEKLNAPDTWQ
jgi:5'-3' exonuclease